MANQEIDNMSVTWNSGGVTFDAIKLNVTDTASAAASRLLELQVGGVTKFRVTKAGDVTVGQNLTITGSATFSGTTEIVASTKVTVFNQTNTFTPDPKMIFCEVQAWGGGGAGGGCLATGGASRFSSGSGGQAGAYAFARLTAAQIGASKLITVGAGGTGVSGANGNAGADSTVAGGLLAAAGGNGGTCSAVYTYANEGQNAALTQSSIGDIKGYTAHGGNWRCVNVTNGPAVGGDGAETGLGGSGIGYRAILLSAVGGNARDNTGAGGGGAAGHGNVSARAGGNGGMGLVVIREYLRP